MIPTTHPEQEAPMPTPVTRETLDAVARNPERFLVSVTLETAHGVPVEGARWTEPAPVTRVFAHGDDVGGRRFLCFYREFGERGAMSHSVKEGAAHARFEARS